MSTNIKPETIEEDELIEEIDIYLNRQLNGQLNLFQFPITENKQQEMAPVNTRMKLKSKQIELDIGIDTNQSTYNELKGRELGLGVDKKPLNTKDFTPITSAPDAPLFDKQSLTGIARDCNTNYLVGVIKNKQLHLSQINQQVIFEPSFKVLDCMQFKIKEEFKKPIKPNDKIPKSIHQQVAKSNEMGKSEVTKNVSDKFREVSEEAWKDMNYSNFNSDYSNLVFSKLFNQDDNITLHPVDSNHEYLDSISCANAEPYMLVDNVTDVEETIVKIEK